MKSKDAKALVCEYFYRLINERDLSVCDELLADDYVDHDAPPDALPGPEEIKRFVIQMLSDRPDIQVTVEDVVAEGNRVAARNTWRWTDSESGREQRQIAERWSAYEMIQI